MRHQSKTGERRISDFFSPFFNQRGREEEDKSVFVFLSILAMTERTRARASYWNQAHALLAKNFIFQKRHMSDTLAVIGFSILFLSMFKATSNKYKPLQPGCRSDDNSTCEFLIPPKWPPVLKIPKNEDRAVRADFMSYSDLPNKSCRKRGSCPITILLTGSNQSIAQDVARHMLPTTLTRNSSNPLDILSGLVLGSDLPLSDPFGDGLDPAFLSSLYAVQQNCSSDSPMMLPLEKTGTEMKCVQGLDLWRNSSSEMNDEIFKGYSQGNPERQTNEIAAAYDFLNSGKNNLDITIWYNSTSEFPEGAVTESLLQVSRLVNLVSNAYLQFLRGPGTKMVLEFIKEMPKFNVSHEGLSLYKFGASLILTSQIHIVSKSLVYDKQHDVRIMMKMHGLGDLTYWMITYGFQLYISSISIPILVGGGMLLGIEYFTKNDWSLQIVFYFLNACLQVSVAFFISAFFCNVKTASVANSLVILLSFISGFFVLDPLLSKASLPGVLVLALEIFPFFALYRGVYEIDQYTARAKILGVDGMRWKDLTDSVNGMKDVMIIMIIESLVLVFIAYYFDQVLSSGNGTRRSPLFFLPNIQRKPSLKSVGSQVSDQMEKPDVAREREKVDRLMLESSANHAIVVNQLRKVYPGRDGNPEKLAVNGLSLALPQAECFGMLGPNGAGKTSFIKMMIGLSEPTFGTALVQGLDIMTHMDEIYCSMGVCPQHDLLWDCLTGREHLMFYGRLKNLKGAALSQAVEESLKGLNLFNGGVPDKVAGKYSGGMKRRLSVAISLIGDPKVVYMDEPSTGLDPASRINLWNVVRRAKQDRAIILTTHSMEEAEALCDRLGIFMNGELQCIGNSKELKARYGGTFVFTMTTTSDYDAEVESMVKGLCQNARKIYHLPGTQKFELPKHEVQIADVFELVEISRNRFPVHAWGLADTTLEDVFIKVIKDAQVKAVPALT